MLKIQEQIKIAPYTSFGIGGPADYLVMVDNREDLVEAIKWARNKSLKFLILGGGSNILVADVGFRGLVVVNRAKRVEFRDNQLVADSGISLAELINQTVEQGLTGLEYFAGIPGSLGGAIYNNAHYNDWLIGNLVESVEVLDKDNQLKSLSRAECQFAYEQSRFQTSGEIILTASLKLKPGKKEEVESIAREALNYRRSNHPQEKSAGCVFQNPGKQRAAELIEQAGLKGFQVGGAQVSPQHAGFIINPQGQAKAEDVLKLIEIIKEKVKQHSGIELEEEIFLYG